MSHSPTCQVDYPEYCEVCATDEFARQSSRSPASEGISPYGRTTEQREPSCSRCGRELRAEVPANSSQRNPTECDIAVLPQQKSNTAQPTPQKSTLPFIPYANARSEFQRRICRQLVQAVSTLDPVDAPWFEIGLGVDLLVIAPHGLMVADIVDSDECEKQILQWSWDPQKAWVLSTVDGRIQQIPNPIGKVDREIRTVQNRLIPFAQAHGMPPGMNKMRAFIVFPEEVDVRGVTGPFPSLEANWDVEVINAKDLAGAILKPIEVARLDPLWCRRWLEAEVLPRMAFDSILGTWLDPILPAADSESRSAFGRRTRRRPRNSGGVESPRPGPARRAATSKKAAVWALALAIAVITAQQIYEYAYLGSPEAVLPLRVNERALDRKETPQDFSSEDGSLAMERESLQEHQPSGVLTETNSESLSPAAKNSSSQRERDFSASAEADSTKATATVANGPAEDRTVSESNRRAIEHQIEEAILNRAVEGVVVSFANGTAVLTGEVLSPSQKAAAEEAARAVPGVKEVYSSIGIGWASR